jgi:hypothetical protein
MTEVGHQVPHRSGLARPRPECFDQFVRLGPAEGLRFVEIEFAGNLLDPRDRRLLGHVGVFDTNSLFDSEAGATEQAFRGSDQLAILLAPVYGWFSEGFDTRDLREAERCSTNQRLENAHSCGIPAGL